jgi:hypothetical protein
MIFSFENSTVSNCLGFHQNPVISFPIVRSIIYTFLKDYQTHNLFLF